MNEQTKWTPGPWTCEGGRYLPIVATHHGKPIQIGRAEGCGDRLSNDEVEANGALIAAAPDLYAALAKYVEHFGDPLKVARPALAKARGESE